MGRDKNKIAVKVEIFLDVNARQVTVPTVSRQRVFSVGN